MLFLDRGKAYELLQRSRDGNAGVVGLRLRVLWLAVLYPDE